MLDLGGWRRRSEEGRGGKVINNNGRRVSLARSVSLLSISSVLTFSIFSTQLLNPVTPKPTTPTVLTLLLISSKPRLHFLPSPSPPYSPSSPPLFPPNEPFLSTSTDLSRTSSTNPFSSGLLARTRLDRRRKDERNASLRLRARWERDRRKGKGVRFGIRWS